MLVFRFSEKQAFEKKMLVFWGVLVFIFSEKQAFEKHYVNKDGKAFRISFNKKPKTIYNLAFNQTFKMKVAKSDDW